MTEQRLQLRWRPFRFVLPRPLITAHGALNEKRGWLLRLEASDGGIGWGEAAALQWRPAPAAPGMANPAAAATGTAAGSSLPAPATVGVAGRSSGLPLPPAAAGSRAACGQHHAALDPIATALAALGPSCERRNLEALLPDLPGPLAFALGLALAELDGLGGPGQPWLAAPASAQLLPAAAAMPAALQALLVTEADRVRSAPAAASGPAIAAPVPLTVKWKVAAADDPCERALLEWLLQQLPARARLRLDANAGWDRATAAAWAGRLAAEPRLEWLEQPLAAADGEGLLALAQSVPVALDESLHHPDGSRRDDPAGTAGWPVQLPAWPGWLVRRPALEGDPRPLLAQLRQGRPRLMLSTALETGIGMRLLAHLAALQQRGPTPTAPGLAPGWRPSGGLFATDPLQVWRAAALPA
ncbi:MAG: enolase C-terminal domain-like protein [Synechococcus sp.]|nr:enolase C-terminal domain-like protein [Synechococcus sp.]